MQVTTQDVNRFQLLLAGHQHQAAPVVFDPKDVLLALLRNSQRICGDYWAASDRINWWVFKIVGGRLAEITVAPRLSDHARTRLGQRFGLKDNLALIAAVDISRGRALSQEERKRLRIDYDQAAVAIQYADRVYLVKNNGCSVVTVVVDPQAR